MISDEGKYQTQLYKIKSLRHMRFAESYNRWITDQENLKYYKLKYASQHGEDIERIAFNYYDKERQRVNGFFNGVVQKRIGITLINLKYECA